MEWSGRAQQTAQMISTPLSFLLFCPHSTFRRSPRCRVPDGNLDAIISNIMNEYEPASRATAARVRESLPSLKIRADSAAEPREGEARQAPGEPCTVCHDTLGVGDVVMELPCNHCFHPDCIMPWLESHNTCPVRLRNERGSSGRARGWATRRFRDAGCKYYSCISMKSVSARRRLSPSRLILTLARRPFRCRSVAWSSQRMPPLPPLPLQPRHTAPRLPPILSLPFLPDPSRTSFPASRTAGGAPTRVPKSPSFAGAWPPSRPCTPPKPGPLKPPV